jgi:hypothetical protein
MILIGLTGRARSGKSSAARGIMKAAEKNGLNAKIFELSDYVLADLKNDGLIPKSATREDLKDNVSLLVQRGMSRREENEDYWIDLLRSDLQTYKPDVAIIPNVRFQNEAFSIKAGFGYIVRVTALVKDGVSFISPDRDPNHVSEISTRDIEADYFLTAKKGHTKLLEKQAEALLNYLLGEAQN